MFACSRSHRSSHAPWSAAVRTSDLSTNEVIPSRASKPSSSGSHTASADSSVHPSAELAAALGEDSDHPVFNGLRRGDGHT